MAAAFSAYVILTSANRDRASWQAMSEACASTAAVLYTHSKVQTANGRTPDQHYTYGPFVNGGHLKLSWTCFDLLVS